jgi:hypothetical protein
MLHLRVVCPSRETVSVTALLRTDPGTAHLVVTPGVATQPPGDVIEAEIARESADGILDQLTKLGLARAGAIGLSPVDTLESETAEAAEAAAPGRAADAVIWEELVATTGEESQLGGVFLAFLTLACLLAAVGVLTDPAITIVGRWSSGPTSGRWPPPPSPSPSPSPSPETGPAAARRCSNCSSTSPGSPLPAR